MEWPLFLIIALVFALYWRTMDYYYLIDDIVRRWGYLLEIPEQSPPPEFFSSKPTKWRHLFLTITHSLVVTLIYFLWGWKAALLFAVMPLSVSCTAWITGGYYQVTTFFVLTSYFFLTIYPGLIGAFLGALFFTAALGSTITCIGFPFIFLVLPPLTGLALFWPLAFYLSGRRFRIGFKKRDIGKGDPMTWRKIFLVPKVLAHYIKMAVVPHRLGFFQKYGFEYGKDPKVKKTLESCNREFWEALGVIAAFVSAGWYFSPIGTMIFLMGILPFTQWKVLGQFIAERYMYFPLVGFCVILANALDHWFMLPVFCAIVAYYTWRSHTYIPAFKNIETLYENGIKNFPDCISNYVNLAERKLHIGQFFEAFKLLKKGLDLDPESFLCHANMAAYWLAIRNPKMGLYHTKMAMKNSETRGMAYNIFRQQSAHIANGIQLMAMAEAEMQKEIAKMREAEKPKEPASVGSLLS